MSLTLGLGLGLSQQPAETYEPNPEATRFDSNLLTFDETSTATFDEKA